MVFMSSRLSTLPAFSQLKNQHFLIILVLAAIWGASFLFMRILAPHLPAFLIANLRIIVAGLFLLGLYIFTQQQVTTEIWANKKTLTIIGLFNSAIPFALYAFAAHHIPAAYSAVLNALTPVFTALIARFYLKTELKKRVYLGLLLGFVGVYFLMSPKLAQSNFQELWQRDIYFILSILACILATICYGIGTNFSKKHGSHISIQSLSAGSQIVIGTMMLPIAVYLKLPSFIMQLNAILWLAILALGILCSGVAYTLFFKLMKEGGPVYASITTFLIPLFGIFWAYVFLGESVPPTTFVSALMILSATFLVLR
jgi:drug/metabolite transporter (DMT)-like permease